MPEEIIEPTTEPVIEPVVEPIPLSAAEIETARVMRQAPIRESTLKILATLAPLIRNEDAVCALERAESQELKEIIKYLEESIPEVRDYLSGVSVDASDIDKINVIKKGLKKRAEERVANFEMPPPFLGNDVEESREKQDDAMTRYKIQYGQIPMVSAISRGRSAIDNPYYESPMSLTGRKSRKSPITSARTRFKLF